jgi:hypothetical protein
MMSNMFTEILSKSNWLKLMDLLFCHFDQTPVILLTPVVLMKELKAALLVCDTVAQVSVVLRTQQSINMTAVNRAIMDYLRHTPPKYFAAVATRHMGGKTKLRLLIIMQ